jgi:hypothetical protein
MAFLQRTMNRGSVSTGYDIDNSLKFEADNSEYLIANSTFASTTPTSNQIGTVSFWIKRTEIGNNVSGKQIYIFASSSSATYSNLGFDEFDNLTIFSGDSSWNSVSPYTYNKFRDTSAWYHIVIRYDSTDGTASNRVRVYSNGTEVSWVTAPNITQNGVMTYSGMNGTADAYHSWGTQYTTIASATKFFSGYLAEAHFVDGQSLAPTEFGEYDSTSGIWKPKAYGGTYGNCGYYLDFADSGNLGDDESGNGFDFDETNIAAADQSTDTPTNNFCTLNQIALDGSVGSSGNITQGATKATATEFDVFVTFAPTFGVTSGKWYAEFEYEGGQADNLAGILDIDAVVPYNSRLGKAGQWSVGFYQANGKLYVTSDSGVTSTANWGASAANGDIISVAVDMDNHFVYFAKNGTWQNSGVPTSGSTGTGGVAFDSNKTVGIGCSSYDQGSDEGQIFANYGGYTAGTISSAASDANGYGTFEYAPPSGYYALCGKNLAEFGGEA